METMKNQGSDDVFLSVEKFFLYLKVLSLYLLEERRKMTSEDPGSGS